MNDNTPMPFGKHEGVALANVPPSYLIFIYDTHKCSGDLRKYIHDNYADLQAEVASYARKQLTTRAFA